jgi:hypothetical protein
MKNSSHNSGNNETKPEKRNQNNNHSIGNNGKSRNLLMIAERFEKIIIKEFHDPELKIEGIARRIGCDMDELNQACKFIYNSAANHHLYTIRFITGIEKMFNNQELCGKDIGFNDSRKFYIALTSRIGISQTCLVSLINKEDGEVRDNLRNEVLTLLKSTNRIQKREIKKRLKQKALKCENGSI